MSVHMFHHRNKLANDDYISCWDLYQQFSGELHFDSLISNMTLTLYEF
jgi:hypothetical protein